MRLEDLLEKTNLLKYQDTGTEEVYDPLTELPPSLRPESQAEVLPEYLINDPLFVGYPDIEMQEDIYRWVAESIPINGYTLKDFGCGRGDFYGWLQKDRPFVEPNYIGIDSKVSMVLSGEKKYPGIRIINSDFLENEDVTDYTVCIGTLNDDHGFDKWEYFNRTLITALRTTKTAVIFILSRNFDGLDGFLDYPFEELFQNFPSTIPFKIDYSKFEDIYKLTVYIDGYN